MVCPMENECINACSRSVIMQSTTGDQKGMIQLTPTRTMHSIYSEVAKEFGCGIDEIEITMQHGANVYVLNNHKDKTIEQPEIWMSHERMSLLVNQIRNDKNMSLNVQDTGEDDLLLGASASPTTGEMPSSTIPILNDYNFYLGEGTSNSVVPVNYSYVGLVNQAMTCYLNSLLQALYMTPEFRNALYNWKGVNDPKSIPYQLQKLFLKLQTSSKTAVETTDLTISFGWQGSDAWHQHDIQELCRVMFDALEQKFKDTEQANLINDLYEGKMLDYVKCLECTTEKSREDTFLDIPLPVRPFGSAVAYNSVVEALRAFVQPETLDGNNQYFCEKCNKKCNAHKGLKFTKFPYLLTLHLKRFDFDYTTMHRIKLNDKVIFPDILNLNSFIIPARVETEPMEERENVVKCDECSTTDSGSADDESCQGTDISSTVNGQDDNCADSDEGIDVSSGNNHNEEEGPYIYELFSIMIHSGSASGGHYYAYIKDFDRNMWFCFNDQSVSGITEEDIKKTYGGGPLHGYYSRVYSSSTNAYMLMYRQIDKNRNARAMTVEEFPRHIHELFKDMERKEEEDRRNKEKANDTHTLHVYCFHPTTNLLQDGKIPIFKDSTLEEAAQDVHMRFKLESLVDISNCRLVKYNKKQRCIDSSFESSEARFGDNINNINWDSWMLEIREPGTEWKEYKTGGVMVKVYPVMLESEDLEDPKIVRVDLDDTVKDLRSKLSYILPSDAFKDHSSFKMVLFTSSTELKYLDNDSKPVPINSNFYDHRLYIANALDEDTEKTFEDSKLNRLIQQFSNVISLTVSLPAIDSATLESMSIPSLDLNQNLERIELGGGDRGTNSPNLRVSPQPYPGDGISDQSNSEDSSLSDSDRTLVGEAPGDHIGLLSSSPNSPSDQHMASPSDPCEDNYNHDVLGHPNTGCAGATHAGEEMSWDDNYSSSVDSTHSQLNYYFKVTSMVHNSDVSGRSCKILADNRMTLERFKQNLEDVVRVPSEYFKIFKQDGNSDDEWSCLSATLMSISECERLEVKLGRVLRKDEVKYKVFYLKPDCMEVDNLLFEHIITKGQTVREVKRDIILQAKKQHMLDIPPNKCRLRERKWPRPDRVLLDDQRFGSDIRYILNIDLYLQELSEPEQVITDEQTVFFVRQWCPSTLTLKPFHEVVMNVLTMDELKQKISEKSGIPVENLDVASIKGNFPCDMNLLTIHNDTDWKLNVTNLGQWPVSAVNGSVFYYKDNREVAKELTEEEKKEINQKENTRLGKQSSKSYSPGREKPLKIYLYPLPKNSDDNCID